MDYSLWMHISKGTILVIGGLKYIKNHVKSFKYVQNKGAIGKSHVGKKMQNRELSHGQSVDLYINSWHWRCIGACVEEVHITHVK